MIYKLVCAGADTLYDLYKKDNDEFIVAIDGGIKSLIKQNIKVDQYIGDLDSISDEEKKFVLTLDKAIILPAKKDDSDLDISFNYLINNLKVSNNDTIILYNATGGRLDHYQAIINSLIKYQDYHIEIRDLNNRIYISDYEMTFSKNDFKYISFFSIEKDTIINLKGFKYDLCNYSLKINDNLCLSNEANEKSKLITNKKVLIFETK